jgi:hypothetical protein
MKKRESSVTKKCRLLCPHEGCGLRRVVKVGDPITLECGHERGELLALQQAHRVSVEHMQTKIGRELFPAVLPRELPVDEHPLDGVMAGLPVPSDAEVIACLEALGEVHNEIEY